MGFAFKETDRSDVAELQIVDRIGYSNDGRATATFEEFQSQLASLSPHVSELDVRISTTGGQNHIGVGMHDLLRLCGFRVTTTIEFLAFSAGAVVSQAGAWRRMAADGVFQMHQAQLTADLRMFPEGTVTFTASELRKYANVLDEATEQGIRIFRDRTGRNADDIRGLFGAFLNADEAKAAGLVDEIVAPRPLPVAFEWEAMHFAPQVREALARRRRRIQSKRQ